MKIKVLVAAIITSLGLLACGGGSGGGSSGPGPGPAPSTNPTRTTPVYYTYFGVSGNQLADTACYTNMVFTQDWGNWDRDRAYITERTVQQLKEAKSRGIDSAIVTVGYLVFNENFTYRGTADFKAFRERLKTEGLENMVQAFYVIDEPDLKSNLQESVLEQAIDEMRIIWNNPFAVIYADRNYYPAISKFDWIGEDRYGLGAESVYSLYPPLVRTDQRYILVPGVADPWRNDPRPFYDIAVRDIRVVAIVNFIWPDHYGTGGYLGVQSNGMRPVVEQIGTQLTGRHCG